MTRTRFVTTTAAVAVVAAALTVAVNAVRGPTAGPTAVVGEIDDFPVDQVVALDYQITRGRIEKGGPPTLFVVNDSAEGLLALWARDPHRGCRVHAIAEDGRPAGMPLHDDAEFVNPCHGEQYARNGSWLAGPAPRGLDRFGVFVDDRGRVVVDATDYRPGPAR